MDFARSELEAMSSALSIAIDVVEHQLKRTLLPGVIQASRESLTEMRALRARIAFQIGIIPL